MESEFRETGEGKGMKLIPILISSLIVGAAVVFVLPFGQNLLGNVKDPTARSVLDNRIVQIAVVGLITSVGIGIFTALASNLPAKLRG